MRFALTLAALSAALIVAAPGTSDAGFLRDRREAVEQRGSIKDTPAPKASMKDTAPKAKKVKKVKKAKKDMKPLK